MNNVEITRKTEYALSALVELASHPGEYISSKIIANRQEIPTNFLPQIMALLSAEGWVIGIRGPGGGVRLAVEPENITINDVIELIEGPIAVTKCLGQEHTCHRKAPCPIQPIWKEAQGEFVKVLRKTSIADLVDYTP